jgi:FkbM family methyltransferase
MAAESDIDLTVRTLFFPNGPIDGVVVDVGAARPSYLSNSESFRSLGWKVIAIEPNPTFCDEYRAAGIEVLQYACSDQDMDNAPFTLVNLNNVSYKGGNVSFESFSSLGIPKSLDQTFDDLKDRTGAQKTTILVKVRRLDRILAEHAPDVREIDLLMVDVEGWELTVLRGLSIDRYKPKVVILENLFNDEIFRSSMAERGYWVSGRVDYNEVYVRADWCTPGSKQVPPSPPKKKA